MRIVCQQTILMKYHALFVIFEKKKQQNLKLSSAANYRLYTMHNKFSNFLCFASLCAHLCAMSNNFKCNDENRILGKWNHEFTDVIL